MIDPAQIGKILIIGAVVMGLAGVLLIVFGRVPWIGRLPGDITFRGRGVTIFAPLATSLLLSLILTILLNLFLRR